MCSIRAAVFRYERTLPQRGLLMEHDAHEPMVSQLVFLIWRCLNVTAGLTSPCVHDNVQEELLQPHAEASYCSAVWLPVP